MRRLWPLLLPFLMLGCGDDDEAAEAPTTTGTQTPETETAPAPEPMAESNPAPEEPAVEPETEAQPPEPLDTPAAPSEGPFEGTLAGLPAVVPGGWVRLDVVPTSTREVDGHRVPSVAITDPEAKASLEPLLAEGAAWSRCRPKLATETFVSVECAYEEDPSVGAGERNVLFRHFQVGEDGRFARASVADLLHPREGRESDPDQGDRELLQLLFRAVEPDEADIVFLRSGIQIVARDDAEERMNLGWRSVAPYLRADSALGRQLAEKGLELAPEGTAMPELPAETWIYRALGPDGAIRLWFTKLSPELQADARLVDPGSVLLAPGHERSELPDPSRWDRARWIGPLATFETRAVSEDDTLRVKPGATDDEEDYEVTAGTRVFAVDGLVGDRRSSPRRGWCYAAPCEDRGAGQIYCFGGWIRARNLEEVAGAAAEETAPAEAEQSAE